VCGDEVAEREAAGGGDEVVVKDDAGGVVGDTAGGEADAEEVVEAWADVLEAGVEEGEDLAFEGGAVGGGFEGSAGLPNGLAGEVGDDESEAFGLHVEAEDVPEGGVEADGDAAAAAAVADDLLLVEEAFGDHLVDEVADAGVGDLEGLGELESGGGAGAVHGLEEGVALVALGLGTGG
jgi:hypothetical protein